MIWKIGRKKHVPKNALRRQTHVYCRNCFQNLKDYAQIRCDRCLVKLNDSRLCFVTRKRLSLREKLPCVFEGWYARNTKGTKSRVTREEEW